MISPVRKAVNDAAAHDDLSFGCQLCSAAKIFIAALLSHTITDGLD